MNHAPLACSEGKQLVWQAISGHDMRCMGEADKTTRAEMGNMKQIVSYQQACRALQVLAVKNVIAQPSSWNRDD